MKTLYEILEVSETASKEIIEKAYKVLAKKYHPDLQQQLDKSKAEEMMKMLNEAYDILSDETKRKKYDEELATKRNKESVNSYNQSNKKQESNVNYSKNPSNNYTNSSNPKEYTNEHIAKEYEKKQEQMQKNTQQQYEAQYQKAYENYLRSLGYKIKYKWTWKRIKELLKTIGIIIIISIIIWTFPPTHKMLVEFYESNEIVKAIINVIGGILTGIWNAICSILVSF